MQATLLHDRQDLQHKFQITRHTDLIVVSVWGRALLADHVYSAPGFSGSGATGSLLRYIFGRL